MKLAVLSANQTEPHVRVSGFAALPYSPHTLITNLFPSMESFLRSRDACESRVLVFPIKRRFRYIRRRLDQLKRAERVDRGAERE
jgi:hypothetical protein